MSAVLVIRGENMITVFSDGGMYESRSDLRLTGMKSKVHKLAHLSLVFGGLGRAALVSLIDHNHSHDWRSFDHCVEVFRSNAIEEFDREIRIIFNEMQRGVHERDEDRDVIGMLFLGGWSDVRQRFETYTLSIDSDESTPVKELIPAAEAIYFPVPDAASLQAVGFDPADVRFGDFDEAPLRFMEAQRETEVEFSKTRGHIVGMFVEQTILTRDFIHNRIVKRWPDRIGELIQP